MREEWKAAVFSGYEVSCLGRVRSLKRNRPLIMRPFFDKDGYSRISLYREDGVQRKVHIHRLVAIAFAGECPADGMEVSHKDGSKTNNHYANLEWKTHRDNIHEKHKHGTWQVGDTHPKSLYTSEQIRSLKRALASGLKLKQAAEATGVRYTVAADVSRGKTWNHVSL